MKAELIPEFMKPLKEFVGAHIVRRRSMVHSAKEKNHFIHSVLGLCHVLVSFGMYETVEEYRALASGCANMLDGRTDMLEADDSVSTPQNKLKKKQDTDPANPEAIVSSDSQHGTLPPLQEPT